MIIKIKVKINFIKKIGGPWQSLKYNSLVKLVFLKKDK
jgi:hypothetical protein